MSARPDGIVPFHFELSSLVNRSVASLYSHLVTRPTGQALRLGIESQIGEIGGCCVSVLDFRQVAVLDYSCADETVAKLILRFQADDRPADAYFVARGLAEHHRDTIEAVLERHGLALVAHCDDGPALLGSVDRVERHTWAVVEELGCARAGDVAERLGIEVHDAGSALGRLTRRRVIFARQATATAPVQHYALSRWVPAD